MSLRTLTPALSLLAVSCSSLVTAQRSDDLTLPLASTGKVSIDVETCNGWVDIEERPGTNQVEIHADFRAGGETFEFAEERVLGFAIDVQVDDAGVHYIRAHVPDGWRSNDMAAFHVTVPDAGATRVKTSNGRLTIEGAEGSCFLTTSNGAVRVERTSGTLRIDTSNGSVRVEDHMGPVEAGSSNGSMRLELADGCVSPFEVDTSNGSIHVEVGPTWSGRVSGRTSNGRVRHKRNGETVSSSRRRLSVEVGGGGEESIATSSNGSITFDVRD